MITEEFKQLYQKYLDNDLSKEELSKFLEILQSGQHDVEMNTMMDSTWKQMFDTAAATSQAKIISLKRTWYRISAAAIIILMLGAGTYFLFFNRAKQAEITKTVLTPDIKAPETNRAMITLGNGQKIYLDSVPNGTLANEGSVRLIKSTDGKVIYDVSKVVTNNTPLTYNTLSNPRGSKVIDMTLSDGTQVWLNAGSSVTYPIAFTGNERKVTITGEAYFEVAHEKSKPFLVSKGDMQVEVLGTHFNVNAYDDESEINVTLLEGSVKVYNNKGAVTIKPGEQVQITINQQPVINKQTDLEEVMGWKNGKFFFTSADIKTIMRQVARWYDVEVIYEERTPDQLFGGEVPRNSNLSQMMKILEYSGVHYDINGKKIIIKK